MPNKKFFVISAGLFLLTLCGCAGIFAAGKSFNANQYYPEFMGLKITPLVYPSAIINNGDITYVHIPHEKPYGELIANVPEGTVITIDHVIRKYNVQNDINDYVMGAIDVPGYKGFVTVGICNGKKHWSIDRCVDSTKYKILK